MAARRAAPSSDTRATASVRMSLEARVRALRLAGGCDGPPGLAATCAERERAPHRSRFGRIRAPTPVAAALRIPQPRLVVARAAPTVLESCDRTFGCENTAPVKLFGYSCAGSFLPRTTASRSDEDCVRTTVAFVLFVDAYSRREQVQKQALRARDQPGLSRSRSRVASPELSRVPSTPL